VITILAAEGPLVPHWTFVVAAGLLFFCGQVALCIRFFGWVRGYEQTVNKLNQDLERGGDGRENIDELSKSFPWLKWVDSNFPAGTTTPGNYTRDDVLQELDTRVASSWDYLLLQRLGVAAPLLGVILTVVGFMWVDPPEDQELSLGEMIAQVFPLVLGVGTGAALALINQFMLHLAGGKAESLRMKARSWFDAAIWSSVGLDTQAATVKAISAIEKMAISVSSSAEQQTENAGRLVESTTAMREAADEFRAMVQALGTDVKGLPETLAELRKATAASANALEELIPVGQRAVAGLDVSVAAFRSTVDHEFIQAAKLHHSSISGLADSVGAISDRSGQVLGDSAEQLQAAAMALEGGVNAVTKVLREQAEVNGEVSSMQQSIREAVARLSDAGQTLNETVKTDVGPSQRDLHAAASSFGDSAQQLAAFIEQGLGPATQRLTELHKTLSGLEGTVQIMRQFNESSGDVEHLAVAMQRAAEAADAIADLPGQIGDTLEERLSLHEEAGNSRSGLTSWFRS
jgi:predicted  nucleic acid-binding Zn-ribbon protein